MNRKYLIMILMIVLTIVSLTPGCAPPQVVESRATPSPDASNLPTATPLLVVRRPPQPATGIEVEVGAISEIAPLPPRRYTARVDSTYDRVTTMGNKLFLIDTVTGNEVRLGNDEGSAGLEAMTDQYAVWYWACSSSCSPPGGRYVYDLAIGEQTALRNTGDVKAAGDWAVAGSFEGIEGYVGVRAFNLVTKEEIVITRALPLSRKYVYWEITYDINEDMIAWVNYDLETQQIAIGVYDLINRSGRLLDIPDLLADHPTVDDLSVSRTQVIWGSRTWEGYDLRYDVRYAIPSREPSGWQLTSDDWVGPLRVNGDYLYWWIDIAGGERHNFRAPIIVRGGATPPTPAVLPTATIVKIEIYPWTTTPMPTDTPMPSETPAETLTPEPPTDTPMPSETPMETPTPEPPTDTPTPPETPMETPTPEPPTDTPAPTDTPLPPPTDTPTPESGR